MHPVKCKGVVSHQNFSVYPFPETWLLDYCTVVFRATAVQTAGYL